MKRRPAPAKKPKSPVRRAGRASGERPIREDLVTQAALEAYGAVRHEGRLSDRALEYTLRRGKQLYSNERRAVAERVYALLRRQRTVDWMLERVHPGFSSMTSTLQDLLRLCASRVLHGEAPRAVAKGSALPPEDAGALERLADAAHELLELPFEQRFPLKASLPDFLAKKFTEQLGPDAERAAQAMNERAPLTIRVNTLKTDREKLLHLLHEEGVHAEPTPLSPLGITLETRINAFSLNTFRDGLFEIQDEGSQLLGMLVDPPPTRVVDACSGAGGKTLQLAAFMKNRGELFALDIDEGRMDELRRRARRDGVHNTRARVIPKGGDEAIAAIADLVGKADRVLVDAPCSGTGTFRRKPDARYRWSPDDLQMHITRQKELLARFASLVKPGGRVVYGTCSILREEDEDIVADFLGTHPEFSVYPAEKLLPPEVAPKVVRNGFLRLFPHLHNTDGFFGAVLLRAK